MISVKFIFIFILLCICALISGENESLSNVSIGETTFLGKMMNTWNPRDKPFHAFRGIRFAKAPVGSRRFKDPKPVDGYAPGFYDATDDQHDCPSIYASKPDEDCLFLNVYVKYLQSELTTLRPVIAFIHPGGFYVGSSLSSFMGPEYLLEHDLVVVTFNYRLAALGFLNLGTEEIPGNAGLKDQVLALRWIQKYISHFGGDPNSVTIMGYSAGAFSASLHLVSPMSQQLFHRAIIMSGSIPPQTILPSEQTDLAVRQARVLGCNTVSTPKQILECLNTFNGTEIAGTLREMFDFGKDNPTFLWLPVIEKDFGQERFLMEDPYKSLQKGCFNKVPILTGFTKNELCTSAVEILTNASLKNEFNQNFDRLAPICFMYSPKSVENISMTLREHYNLPVGELNESHIQPLCNLFSDAIIRFGSHRLAEIASKFTDVYTYKFTYVGTYSYLHYPKDRVFGVEHMDDLMYIFRGGPTTFSSDSKDVEVRAVKMSTLFISTFAANGNVNKLYNSKDGTVQWSFANVTFIEIDHVDADHLFSLKNGRNFDEYTFWNNLDFRLNEI